MATLTAANSAISLMVRGLFPVPQLQQGYATDSAWTVSDVSPVEVMMGVDGKLSGGFTPYPTPIDFEYQADSPSIAMFDAVLEAQKASKEAFVFDGTALIQGTGNKYALTKGYLTSAAPMETGKKVLQSRKFTITFECVSKAPV